MFSVHLRWFLTSEEYVVEHFFRNNPVRARRIDLGTLVEASVDLVQVFREVASDVEPPVADEEGLKPYTVN